MMGRMDDGNLGGICGYAKSKYEERVAEKKQRRSYSEPPSVGHRHGQGKLHKPPQPQSMLERPRNRLRKQFVAPAFAAQPTNLLFVLEYEPYPHLTQPSKVLGVYSTFDAVTLGALQHGAYTFSREGILDGSEYLSPTGRIKIVQTDVQRSGVKVVVPERSHSLDGEHVRLDIPHPQSQEERASKVDGPRRAVYLAVREDVRSASWIGVYEDKSLAWGACLKDKAMCTVAHTLSKEVTNIGDKNMPQVSGRLGGLGRVTWMTQEYQVDGPGH
ncbi:hypothetical protein DE146DRAFT_753461 [Phaeosphaeria sp. MPI-PUGE-AT-0046c]|nr:hypothetical protein DE146DRAFT_753461 [Phaeosphaeria sp. MPI-PUGE-AT-0046c]